MSAADNRADTRSVTQDEVSVTLLASASSVPGQLFGLAEVRHAIAGYREHLDDRVDGGLAVFECQGNGVRIHVGRDGLHSGDLLDSLTGRPGCAPSNDSRSLEEVRNFLCLRGRHEGDSCRQRD